MSIDNKISNLSHADLNREFVEFFDSDEQIVIVTRTIEYSVSDFREGRENWTPEAIFEMIKAEAEAEMRHPVSKWELRYTNEDETEIG